MAKTFTNDMGGGPEMGDTAKALMGLITPGAQSASPALPSMPAALPTGVGPVMAQFINALANQPDLMARRTQVTPTTTQVEPVVTQVEPVVTQSRR
jgi:hypothetical protein